MSKINKRGGTPIRNSRVEKNEPIGFSLSGHSSNRLAIRWNKINP